MYERAEYQVICECCGKSFIRHDKRKRFCSQKCKDVSYKRSKGQDSRLEPYHLECIVCGKAFDTFNPSKKTCCDECSNIHRSGKHIEHEMKCSICGSVYKTYWQSQKTCGDEKCKMEYYAKKHKERNEKWYAKVKIERKKYRIAHSVERECKICGTLFYCLDKEIKCTCSSECSRENTRRKRNHHNDTRINKNNLVDRDISLEKLFIRDNGICYLCGKPCDWNDYEMRNDIKICGKTYPSIDHVVPLARGGKHQWENVRLAHWMCNVNKGDTTPTYTKEMSKEHARKMAIARSTNKKKTAQYTLDGKLIKIWDSTAQIERELGLNSKHIQNICRRVKSKTGNSYGYHWEYIT